MTQSISKEVLKNALLELAQSDREFFLALWKDIFKAAKPATSKPQPIQRMAAKKIAADTFLKRLRRYKVALPADYHFNRAEANER